MTAMDVMSAVSTRRFGPNASLVSRFCRPVHRRIRGGWTFTDRPADRHPRGTSDGDRLPALAHSLAARVGLGVPVRRGRRRGHALTRYAPGHDGRRASRARPNALFVAETHAPSGGMGPARQSPSPAGGFLLSEQRAGAASNVPHPGRRGPNPSGRAVLAAARSESDRPGRPGPYRESSSRYRNCCRMSRC